MNNLKPPSDGILMPGVGDPLGAGFEVNLCSNLNIKSRSILGSKSGSSVLFYGKQEFELSLELKWKD